MKEMDFPSLVCENKMSVEKKDLVNATILPFIKEENKDYFQ